MAYGSTKPGHPADSTANIKEDLSTTTDIFLVNMYLDWQLSQKYGGNTPITERMIKLIEEELKCRELI